MKDSESRSPAGVTRRATRCAGFAWLVAAAGVVAAFLAVVAIPATVLAADGASGRQFEPVTVDLTPQRLSERVWFVQGLPGMISTANQGFNSNAGFVVTDEGVVVFDALGSPSLGESLLAEIRKITDQPVRRVIVSHYHADHFYGVQPFKAAGAEIWAHEKVTDYLATDAPVLRLAERRQSLFPWVDERARITPPDVTIGEQAVFELGGLTFRLFHVGPAHTPEDLMMYVEQEQALFAGDLVFAGRVPFVGTADSRAWLAALDDLAARRPNLLLPGHGAASRQAAQDIEL